MAQSSQERQEGFLSCLPFRLRPRTPSRAEKNDLDTAPLKNKTRKNKQTEPRKITLSYKSTQPYEKNRRSAPTMFWKRIRRSAIFGDAIYEVRQFPPLLLWKAIGGKHNGYGENYLLKKKTSFSFQFKLRFSCSLSMWQNNRPPQ